MSSVRSFSSAASAAATDDNDGSWTQVSRRGGGNWGPARQAPAPAPAPAGTRAFSFAAPATVAALDGAPPTMPPRAPSFRTPSAAAPPPPKGGGGAWSAARPAGAVAAAAAPKTVDVKSMTDFPTLGGAAAPRPMRKTTTAAAPATTWSQTIASATAPAPSLRTPATDDLDSNLSFLRSRLPAAAPVAAATQRRSRLANIGSRCFDDGPTDYTGPEEFDDDDGAGSYHEVERRAGTPVAEEGEFNADLAVSRRAGDKSDW